MRPFFLLTLLYNAHSYRRIGDPLRRIRLRDFTLLCGGRGDTCGRGEGAFGMEEDAALWEEGEALGEGGGGRARTRYVSPRVLEAEQRRLERGKQEAREKQQEEHEQQRQRQRPKRKSPDKDSLRAQKYPQTKEAKLARKARAKKRKKQRVIAPDPPRCYFARPRKLPTVRVSVRLRQLKLPREYGGPVGACRADT